MDKSEEIAGWLREAAVECEDFRDWLESEGHIALAVDKQEQATLFRQRATQVEKMRCGECEYYSVNDKEDLQIGSIYDWCSHPKIELTHQGPDFGCWHFKTK